MDTMFDTLLQLPLFQGLTLEDLTTILDKVKLHFVKHRAKATIIKSGEICDGLCFLLKGEVEMVTYSAERTFAVEETVTAPHVMEPQSLFGFSTRYVSSYTAKGEAHTVSIKKEFILSNLAHFEIFRIAYFNMLSGRAQHLQAKLWDTPCTDTRGKVIRFFLQHCERPEGEKTYKIKMSELARQTDESRLNVSRTLNRMRQEGLLQLRRQAIVIPQIKDLTV